MSAHHEEAGPAAGQTPMSLERLRPADARRLATVVAQRDALLAAAPLGRRRFLALGGGALAAALLAACDSYGPEAAQPLLRLAERQNEKLQALLMRHTVMNFAPDAPLAGAAFPRYFISPAVPVWDESVRGAWRLEVGGLVARPLTLSLDDLVRMPAIEQRVDHFCVEGWTAVARWRGVRVRDLAQAAAVRPEAQAVDFQSFDEDYHESWDMESATHAQTIVAYAMDGAFLGPGHGAPARLHSPVKLGYKSVKYLTRIEFLPERNGGYWTDRGYEWYAGT